MIKNIKAALKRLGDSLRVAPKKILDKEPIQSDDDELMVGCGAVDCWMRDAANSGVIQCTSMFHVRHQSPASLA